MMNKKGLFFWIELILLIVVLILIILSFPRSQDGFLANKNTVDMSKLGFSTLQSLDNAGVFENYINAADFGASDFTAFSVYIKASLPNTLSANIEYFNGTNCTSENNTLIPCGNTTHTKDTGVAEYTLVKLEKPVSIILYMRRIL